MVGPYKANVGINERLEGKRPPTCYSAACKTLLNVVAGLTGAGAFAAAGVGNGAGILAGDGSKGAKGDSPGKGIGVGVGAGAGVGDGCGVVEGSGIGAGRLHATTPTNRSFVATFPADRVHV